jgi:hypothetical protein
VVHRHRVRVCGDLRKATLYRVEYFLEESRKTLSVETAKKNTPTFLSSSAGAFSVPAIIRFRPITGDRIRLLHRPLQLLELPVALCPTRRLTTLHVAALPSSGLNAAVDVLEGPGTSWRDGRGRACSDLGWGRARRPGREAPCAFDVCVPLA